MQKISLNKLQASTGKIDSEKAAISYFLTKSPEDLKTGVSIMLGSNRFCIYKKNPSDDEKVLLAKAEKDFLRLCSKLDPIPSDFFEEGGFMEWIHAIGFELPTDEMCTEMHALRKHFLCKKAEDVEDDLVAAGSSSGTGGPLGRSASSPAGDTKGAAQVWHSKLPVAYHNTPWTADRAIEWLRHGRDEDKPFCTWVSFPDPHHPFDCPEPWSRLHDPKDVDLPENRERSYEGKPWWHKAAMEGEPADPKFADIRKAYSRIPPQTDEQLREIIANTYGQISFIDHQIGRIMNVLMEQELDKNTIVIYMSDHGDWLGDHGLILKGPMHYEGLLKVPMIVKGPGAPAGKVVDEPVSTLDLGATFCDYGNAEAQLTQHGSSLRPLIEGDATRSFARNEWGLLPGRVGVALELRTVRTRTHKLTVDLISGAGELYDLEADPDEMTNLFDMPQTLEIQATLLGYIASRPQDMLPDQTPVGTA